MTDERLRELERRAAMGDPAADRAWFAAASRTPPTPPVVYFVRYYVGADNPVRRGQWTWFAKIGERYTRADTVFGAYPFAEDELAEAIQRAGSNMSGEVLMAGSAVAPYEPLTRVWPVKDLVSTIGAIPI